MNVMHTTYKCPLCGFEFKESAIACKGCPLVTHCEVICCPHCNYQWPKSSKIVDLGKKIFKKNNKI